MRHPYGLSDPQLPRRLSSMGEQLLKNSNPFLTDGERDLSLACCRTPR